jgi:TolC family type I secretion outer membrane protein
VAESIIVTALKRRETFSSLLRSPSKNPWEGDSLSVRSVLSKTFSSKRHTASRAERAFVAGRFADAATMFRELADIGNVVAQLRLAQLYEHGQGVLQSFVEAVRWYRAAAEQGCVQAQARLGEIYLTGLEPPATASASAIERIHAPEAGGSLLNRLFPQGLSVRPDPQQAAHWNNAAAQRQDADAQARLGYQFAAGLGLPRDLTLAEKWFSAAAAQNQVAGQLGLGMLYSGSFGGSSAIEMATDWLEKAAAQGNATAKLCLALLLLYGEGVSHDEERARGLLEEAANAGQPAAMFHLGELYRLGHGGSLGRSQAETWLRRSVARGHVKALLSLVQLFNTGPEPDANTAAVLCRQAAELGDGEAQYWLGQFYLAGKGVPPDPMEAARWISKAADQGITAAYERLGALYAEGHGLPQDFQAAADWFNRAAVNGDTNALYHLGTLQLHGLGVPRDPVSALAGYQSAAEKGSGAASLQLGVIYATGQEVPQDYAEAAKWYSRAAEQGVPEALYNLAFLHFRGLGVRQNTKRALAFLEQAAEAGSVQAAWALYDQFTDSPYVVQNSELAAHWLLQTADLGSAQATCLLAEMLDRGDQKAPPKERVVTLLAGSAARGDGAAQVSLAIWYLEGKHGLHDAQLALRWFHRAAHGGNAFAQAWLGDAYATGQGVKPNLAEASLWYERAALQGHGGATRVLTKMGVAAGENPEQMARLFTLWLKGAEAGDAIAQRVVGDFYMRGVGIGRSVVEAERWLTASADQGDTVAMVLLAGLILENPDEAEKFPQSVELFKRAAARGNCDAEYNLGVCLRRGLGVKPDSKAAERSYRAAAERNHVSAQLALGDLIADGAACDEEWQEAMHWYRLAAESGSSDARMRLVEVQSRLDSQTRKSAPSDETEVQVRRESESTGRVISNVGSPLMSLGLGVLVSAVFSGAAHAGAAPDPFRTETQLQRDTYGLTDPLGHDCAIPGGRLTFPAAVNFALCRNPQTRAAWAAAHQQAAALGSAESAWLPTISATGAETRNYGEHADVNGNIVSTPQNTTDAVATLSWTLYDFGGRGGRIQSARSLLDAAAYTANSAVQQVVLSVVQAYYGSVAADALLASAKITEQVTGRSLEIARALASGGVGSLGDVLQAETAHEQAILARVQADQAAKSARGTLSVTLGLTAEEAFGLDADPVPKEVPALSSRMADLMAEAARQRPDLKAAQAQRDAAEANITVARATGRPSISLGALHSFTDTPGVPNQNYNQIGITVTVPIFSGFKVLYDVRQAQAALQSQDINLEQVGLSVTLDVWNGYYALDSSNQQLGVTADLVTTSDNNLQVALGRYQAGLGSILDVLTAQTAAATARQLRINAELGWRVARAQLSHAIGRLTSAEPLTKRESPP